MDMSNILKKKRFSKFKINKNKAVKIKSKKDGKVKKEKKEKKNIFVRLFTKVKHTFRVLKKEFRLIRWCSLKELVRYSLIAIFYGALLALLLTGFDWISQLIISFLGGVI